MQFCLCCLCVSVLDVVTVALVRGLALLACSWPWSCFGCCLSHCQH